VKDVDEQNQNYHAYQIRVKKGRRLYDYFTEQSQLAKNLYNHANYYIRQVYTAVTSEQPLQANQQKVMNTIITMLPIINENQQKAWEQREEAVKAGKRSSNQEKPKLFSMPTAKNSYLGYSFLDVLFRTMREENYVAISAQTAQGVLKNLNQNWKSYFASAKDYKKHPNKYLGKPRIPKYLDKNVLKEVTFTNQYCTIKDGKYLKFPLTKEQLNIGKLGVAGGKLQEVRVIPAYDHFTVEVILSVEPPKEQMSDNGRYIAIDLGTVNLITMVTNIVGLTPILFRGGHIKALNQLYNKLNAKYYSILRKGHAPNEGQHTSKRLQQMARKRHDRIKDAFHKMSRYVVDYAMGHEISKIVIGHNVAWKQEVNMGRKNNQNFVFLPHSLLIEMITYKAKAVGIEVVVTEESYTSKASALDGDIIPTYGESQGDAAPRFSGKRVKRGLYVSKDGTKINADVNGAMNILRKVVPNAFVNVKGIVDYVNSPLVVHYDARNRNSYLNAIA
jgi:putative transposase